MKNYWRVHFNINNRKKRYENVRSLSNMKEIISRCSGGPLKNIESVTKAPCAF
jgi:hypothetical protein